MENKEAGQVMTYPKHDCQEEVCWTWHMQKPYTYATCGICKRMVKLEKAPELTELQIALKEAEGVLEENANLRRELKGAHEVVQLRDKRIDDLKHMLSVCVAVLEGVNREDTVEDVIKHSKIILECPTGSK